MIKQETIKPGDHIFSITDEASKITTALDFLKLGLVKNESVMLISDLDKDKIRSAISKEWDEGILESLETNRDIILKSPEEVLYSDGTFPLKTESLIWKDLTDLATNNDKAGLRIFIDVSPMIKAGLEKQVLKFESTLDKKFDFPCTIVCSYAPEDLKKMGNHGVEILKNHHNVIWFDKNENIPSEKAGVKIICKTCGKEFDTDSAAIYCSFECAYDFSK